MNTNKTFVSPTGSIELDNDCQYSIDKRSVRSRESVSKDDVIFFLNNYIEPKYGLGNINVNNVASFMKDLEMNWTKLTPELKDKVLDIMVDYILNNPKANYDFKSKLLNKLNISSASNPTSSATTNPSATSTASKSTFGNTMNMYIILLFTIICLVAIVFLINKFNKK